MKIRAMLLITIVPFLTTGCQAFAQALAQQQAEQRAQIQNLKNAIEQLTPEQKAEVRSCSEMTIGRVRALRIAASRRIESWQTMNLLNSLPSSTYAVVSDCMANPYYCESIPRPEVSTSAEQNNIKQYEEWQAACAMGSAACP